MSLRQDISNKIERLLRKTALRGSDRPIPWDRPVGGGGLGLDSLALVEFVIAVEKEFGVEVPDSMWKNLPEITPGWFVDVVESAAGSRVRGQSFLDRLKSLILRR